MNAFMGDSVASPTVWIITIVVTVGVLLIDLLGHRPPPARAVDGSRSAGHLAFFIGAGGDLRALLWSFFAEPHELSPNPGAEFYAGWLTEYSLSVDNLFVFIIIMSRFGVPRKYQQEALLVGIILALIFRGDVHRRRCGRDQHIAGSSTSSAPSSSTRRSRWQAGDDEEDEYKENRLIRFTQNHLPATDKWHGIKPTSRRTASGSSRRCSS